MKLLKFININNYNIDLIKSLIKLLNLFGFLNY